MTSEHLTGDDDRLRHQLGLLYADVGREIRRRNRGGGNGAAARRVRVPGAVERLRQEAPEIALEGVARLATTLLNATGRDVLDLRTVHEAYRFLRRQRELGQRGTGFEVDDFGFDQEWTESLLPIFRWLYNVYWRVEATGIENVPPQGRALLVSNHAGVLPWDGAMIKTAILEHHPTPRHARALIAQLFFGLPLLSWFLRRTGNTVGHPDDTIRLLERDELVLVFPEGTRGTGKLWNERYRLRRFGRGGYVQVAIRARSAIVPISVVGSEEIYPMIGNLAPLAKLTGFPYFPVTPFFPLLGPLGAIPLPSKWRIQFHAPIRTDLIEAERADDQHLVMALSDEVRDRIQAGLYENLKLRRGTFY